MNPPGQRYDKPALDEHELIERYIERGLIITDRNRAARYLRHIGYYRLSPYTIPFQADRTTHSFKSGTTFDDILYIYVFDRQLRLLTMDALERVEVLVERERQRTPSDRGEQADHLHYPDALSHYLATYSSPATPPSFFAHHGRLWNRFLGVYPVIPRSPTVRWLTDRSIFDTGNPKEAPPCSRLSSVDLVHHQSAVNVDPETARSFREVPTYPTECSGNESQPGRRRVLARGLQSRHRAQILARSIRAASRLTAWLNSSCSAYRPSSTLSCSHAGRIAGRDSGPHWLGREFPGVLPRATAGRCSYCF